MGISYGLQTVRVRDTHHLKGREAYNRTRAEKHINIATSSEMNYKSAGEIVNMANIDTSLIEGYEAMSADEKIAALTSYDFTVPEDKTAEVAKLKQLNDKYSSEIAAFKKREKEGMDEATRKTTEMAEQFEALKAENETYKKQLDTERLTRQNVALGYTEELAKEKAIAVIENDTDRIYECEKKYREALEKQFKAEYVKKTPGPDDKGYHKVPTTKEDLAKMSPSERFKFAQEHPDEYNTIYGGK